MSDKKISELLSASAIDSADISVLIHNNTDYQFSFATLLEFIGSNLTIGANISFGTTLPANTFGKNGDVFINTGTGSFAQKLSGIWTVAYTIPSSGGTTDGTILYGLGLPGTLTGNNNDTYINIGTGIFYKKTAGSWNQVFSMQTGPAGATGSAGTNGTNGTNGFSVLSGSTTPSNLDTGINGDFYINTSNYTIFGPKASGNWGIGTSLIGDTGAGAPSGGTTGQILAKQSDDDFDSVWIDFDLSAYQLKSPYFSIGANGENILGDIISEDNIQTFPNDGTFPGIVGLKLNAAGEYIYLTYAPMAVNSRIGVFGSELSGEGEQLAYVSDMPDLSVYVPYTDATSDLNLGDNLLSVGQVDAQRAIISDLGTFVNNGTDILQLHSHTKGFLLPSMLHDQMNAIVSPTAGSLIYENQANHLANFDGTAWRYLATITDLGSYVPYSGADNDVNLGAWGLISSEVDANLFRGGQFLVSGSSSSHLGYTFEGHTGIGMYYDDADGGSIVLTGSHGYKLSSWSYNEGTKIASDQGLSFSVTDGDATALPDVWLYKHSTGAFSMGKSYGAHDADLYVGNIHANNLATPYINEDVYAQVMLGDPTSASIETYTNGLEGDRVGLFFNLSGTESGALLQYIPSDSTEHLYFNGVKLALQSEIPDTSDFLQLSQPGTQLFIGTQLSMYGTFEQNNPAIFRDRISMTAGAHLQWDNGNSSGYTFKHDQSILGDLEFYSTGGAVADGERTTFIIKANGSITGGCDISDGYTDYHYIQKIWADTAYQAKENQTLSTGNSVNFDNLTLSGNFIGGALNLDGTDLSDFYTPIGANGKVLIGSNRSGSLCETDFINTPNTDDPISNPGGFDFRHITNDGIETVLMRLSGNDYAASFTGRISPGIMDLKTDPAIGYLTYDDTTNTIQKRNVGEIFGDLISDVSESIDNSVDSLITVNIGGTFYQLLARVA